MGGLRVQRLSLPSVVANPPRVTRGYRVSCFKTRSGLAGTEISDGRVARIINPHRRSFTAKARR